MTAAVAATATFRLRSPRLHNSQFLGQNKITTSTPKSLPPLSKSLHRNSAPTAKFNPSEILGGRGLCNGEAGLQQELKKTVVETSPKPPSPQQKSLMSEVPGDGFEKELMGMTGGFPGGERGLKKFIDENPPPKKGGASPAELGLDRNLINKPKPPELPMLLPGMIAIVKNPNNPFYMYCGIVQRITDGKAGVLFEGGNWDRLITFRLEELERREKGPPMISPKSAILEEMLEKS